MAKILTKLKILITGGNFTGKSSILKRFVDDKFDENENETIGIDFKRKDISLNYLGGIFLVQLNMILLDITVFDHYNRSCYRDAQGVLLVYDVTDKTSLYELESWLKELEISCMTNDVVKIVVGNKIDKPNRQVTTEEGMQFARRHKCLFVESSAKTAEGIKCCFDELVRKIIETPGLWKANDGVKNHMGKRGIQLVDNLQTLNTSRCCC